MIQTVDAVEPASGGRAWGDCCWRAIKVIRGARGEGDAISRACIPPISQVSAQLLTDIAALGSWFFCWWRGDDRPRVHFSRDSR